MRRVHWPRRTRGASAVGGGNAELVLLPTSRSSGPPDGLGHGMIGAAVSAWSAVALVGSYELLMVITRSAQFPAAPVQHGDVPAADPLGERRGGVRG